MKKKEMEIKNDPQASTEERDTRPTFETTPGLYAVPVPIVTHVHCAGHISPSSTLVFNLELISVQPSG